MGPPRNINTAPRRVCKPHLRKLFRDEQLWEKYYTGELDIKFGPLKPRDMIDETPFHTHIAWSQELKFIHPVTGRQVCRAHIYLSDDLSIAASGAPDPKEINWEGVNTHLHQDGGVCQQCESGDLIGLDYEEQQRRRVQE